MENRELYVLCLADNNIKLLIDVIREEVMLGEKSIPKYAQIIKELMRRNISKLDRPLRNKEEIIKMHKYI